MPPKLLVLDLDETLIYATQTPLAHPADFSVYNYHVYRRPHLAAFIEYVAVNFQVGVWTSSGENYAAGVVDALFPHAAPAFVWSSVRCTLRRDLNTDTYHSLKKLEKLKRRGYALESVIFVDDSPEKHIKNYGNLVRVSEFTGQPDDDELLHLIEYLEHLKGVPNIRAVEKRGWKQAMARRR